MMTREEAKEIFLNRGYIEVEGGTIFDGDKWREACSVISKWLEQEHCEDAISRDAAIKALDKILVKYKQFLHRGMVLELAVALIRVPTVQPKEKVGHWIDITNKNGTVIAVRCNRCGKSPKHAIKSDFCPNCGSPME